MTKRKGDFRSKIDSILADDPKPRTVGGSRKGRDRRFGTDGVRRSGRDALARHLAPTTETKLDEIDLNKIKLPRGRRTDADPELNDSIGRSGILQPLLLRPIGSGYEVLDGGRRLAVARELGLQAVPAVVRTIADPEARAMSAERRAVATAPPRRGRPPSAVRAPAAGSTRKGRAAAAVQTSAVSTRKGRVAAAVQTSAVSTRKGRAAASVPVPAAASTRKGRAAAPVPVPAAASTRRARPAAPVPVPAASTRQGRAAAAVPVPVAVSSRKGRVATPAPTARADAAKQPAANSSAKKQPITRRGSTTKAIARGAVEAPKVVVAPEATVAAPARKYRRAPARPEPVARAAGAAVPSVPVEAPPAAEPEVAFGPADEAVEMRRPSIAETAAAEATIIWQHPGETEREDTPEDEADEKPVPPGAVAATPAATTTSFARPDELTPALPLAAAPARTTTALATERPPGGRNVLGTAFFLLALFAAAFAVTTWVAYNDVGLAVQAGLVGVIALVLFSAVILTGRRTGP